MKTKAIIVFSLFSFAIAACGSEPAPPGSTEVAGSTEQALSGAYDRVLFTGSFHLGGTLTQNPLEFEVDFVDESNTAAINAGHGGLLTLGNAGSSIWQDANGGGEIDFSPSDLGSGGGFVIWKRSGGAFKAKYQAGWYCVDPSTHVASLSGGASGTVTATTYVPFNCPAGQYSSFFAGSASFYY